MALWILNSLWNWNLVVLKITLLPLVMLSRFFWPSSTPIIVQFTVLLLLDRTLGGCIFICPKNLLWNAHPGYHTFDFRVLTIWLVLSFLENLFTSEFPYFALLNSFLTFPLLGIKPPSALPWLYPFPWTPFLHLIVNGSKSERHISIAFTLKSITSTLDQRMV